MGMRKDGRCTAVLIDLGLSLATAEIEREIKLFSPNAEDLPMMYCAPELYSGFEDNFELAKSADIYALGCMLFELLDKRSFYTTLQETNGSTFWEAAIAPMPTTPMVLPFISGPANELLPFSTSFFQNLPLP